MLLVGNDVTVFGYCANLHQNSLTSLKFCSLEYEIARALFWTDAKFSEIIKTNVNGVVSKFATSTV